MTGMGRVDGRVDTEPDGVGSVARPSGRWPYSLAETLRYGAGLVAPVIVAALALDERAWLLALVTGAVAVVVYGRATARYRTWAINPAVSGFRLGVCASIGVFACVSGAFVLEHASDENSRFLAAIGVALVVVGLMPVMHAIRYEPDAPEDGRPWDEVVFGWELNALFAFAALTPGLLILGAPVVVAVFLPAAWLASVAVNRLSRFPWYVRVVVLPLLAAAVVSGVWFMTIAEPGSHVPLVIGLLLVCLGCVDAVSAPVRRRKPVAWSAKGKAIAGAAVAAALLVSLVLRLTKFKDVTAVFAIGVVAGCFVFGGSYIRRGQGLVVLGVLAGLTLWVIGDRDDHAPLDPAPNGTRTIVALGDSYASGEGAEAFFANTSVQEANQCRRSSNAYGYQVARQLGSHLHFFACSGALAEEVWRTPQVAPDTPGDEIGELPQLQNPVRGDPDLVLISIGGNDALFGPVGRGCALPGSCVDIKHIFDGNLGYVRTVVTDALEQVGRRYENSPIVVVPYPQMLPTPPAEGETRAKGDCDGVPLGDREIDYLHGFVTDLDEQVELAVAGANARLEEPNIAYFAPGEAAYIGHHICGPGNGDSAVNTLAFAPTEAANLFDRLVPTSWTHNSFHPKRLGHDLLAETLVPWIRHNVPGFGGRRDLPETLAVEEKRPPQRDGTCSRDECTREVNDWSTGKTIEAIQIIFPFAVLIGFAGWLLAAVRRLPIRLPRRRTSP
jgi:hypothetical protein